MLYYIYHNLNGFDQVMCDAYTPAGEPIPTNKRHAAAKVFSHPDVVAEVPWYGIEQEYTLLQKDVNWPVGWPIGGFPGPQVKKMVILWVLFLLRCSIF